MLSKGKHGTATIRKGRDSVLPVTVSGFAKVQKEITTITATSNRQGLTIITMITVAAIEPYKAPWTTTRGHARRLHGFEDSSAFDSDHSACNTETIQHLNKDFNFLQTLFVSYPDFEKNKSSICLLRQYYCAFAFWNGLQAVRQEQSVS
jgi:hypothetical protein